MALASLGVVNQPLARFKDYHSDRSQFVVVQGSSSPLSSVTSGVPQGSILDPLLFIVAFDGIFHLLLSNSSSLIGCTDDLTYFRNLSCNDDLTAINSDLAKVSGWIEENSLGLNLSKVKAMVISTKKNLLLFLSSCCLASLWALLTKSSSLVSQSPTISLGDVTFWKQCPKQSDY